MTKHYTAPPFALGVSKRVLKDPSTDSSSGNVAVSAYGAVVAAGLVTKRQVTYTESSKTI